MMSMQN